MIIQNNNDANDFGTNTLTTTGRTNTMSDFSISSEGFADTTITITPTSEKGRAFWREEMGGGESISGTFRKSYVIGFYGLCAEAGMSVKLMFPEEI